MIENKTTPHKKLENGRWLCISSGCSMAAGQSKELKQTPKTIYQKPDKWYLKDAMKIKNGWNNLE